AMSALLGALAIHWAEPVQAQVPGGYTINHSRKPVVSPYINLLRSNTDPGVNYYGIVRPEIAARNSIVQLQEQQSVAATQQQEAATTLILPTTGHASGFLTQSKYFMTKGGQGSPGSYAPVTPLKAGP